MPEYIEREALIAEIKDKIHAYWNPGYGDGYYLAEDALKESIETAPAADVAPVVHGKPIYHNRPEYYAKYEKVGTAENGEPIFRKRFIFCQNNPIPYCPVCGKRLCSRFTNYCPNCGAKMQGDGNEKK